MKRYVEHIKTKEPHERRKHAMQLSGIFVAVLFVVWVATFSARLGAPAQSPDTNPTQAAAAANATTLPAGASQLEVSTSSVYSQ